MVEDPKYPAGRTTWEVGDAIISTIYPFGTQIPESAPMSFTLELHSSVAKPFIS